MATSSPSSPSPIAINVQSLWDRPCGEGLQVAGGMFRHAVLRHDVVRRTSLRLV